MQGEQLPPNQTEQTLVHGQEPIVVSRAGDPDFEARLAKFNNNEATQREVVESIRATSAAREAVSKAQLERPMGEGSITEMPTFAPAASTEPTKPTQEGLEVAKTEGARRHNERHTIRGFIRHYLFRKSAEKRWQPSQPEEPKDK